MWQWAAAFQIWVTGLVPPAMWDSIIFQGQAKMDVKDGARTGTPLTALMPALGCGGVAVLMLVWAQWDFQGCLRHL